MSAYDLTEFGNWLKRRRVSLDLTQKELADAAGCTISTIRQLERGQRRPSKQVAELLSACLEIGPEEYGTFTKFARGTTHDAAQHPLPVVAAPPGQYSASPTGPARGEGTLNSTYPAVQEVHGEVAATDRQAPVTHLPAYLTSFIGREQSLAQVRR